MSDKVSRIKTGALERRFTLARAGDGEVLFRSVQFRRHIQFWRFDVKYWVKRYFSE